MAIVNKFNVNREQVTLDVIYDVTTNNTGVKFSSLSELLSSENLSTLIPLSVRYGGMSVRFIQSSDNKYVQYRLMTNEFTTDTTQWAIADEGVYVENSEFVYVKTDAEGKILWAIKIDGSIYYGTGVPSQIIDYINEKLAELSLDEYEDIVAFLNNLEKGDKTLQTLLDEKVDKEEGKSLIDENISESLSVIEDKEGRSEITIDSEGKIISYRDADGVKYEEVGIKTKQVSTDSLILSDDCLSDLEKNLKEHGFISSLCDWSDAKELHIAEPQCAIINFKGITDVPTTKTADAKTIMEFWDMHGNYFKKETIVNAQGTSSLFHPKRGMTVDICNNNGWDDNDTFKLQIGDWVPQDSFHLKAYYADPFRCVSPIAYKLMDEVLKTRGVFNDYVWKKALLDLDSITATSNGVSTAEDAEKQFTTGARCISDGFPCIVYMEGEFYGIYAWQLKKHRDNYQMSKKNANHIHLDGVLGLDTFFGIDNFDWSWFEVRNPKNLVYAEAHNDLKGNPTYKYDADNAGQFEIAGNHDGSTTYDTWTANSYAVNKIVLHNSHYFLNTIDGNTAEPVYDSENNSDDTPDFKNNTGCGWLNVTNTIKVKEYVIKLSKLKGTLEASLKTYKDSSKTAEDLAAFREVVEEYLDPDSMIDYYIVSDVIRNYDGFKKNWQWITYDGKKWYIVMWDCDGCLGNWWELTNLILSPLTEHIYTDFPYNCILTGWDDELKKRYAELRNVGILSEHHITSMILEWHGRLGNKNTFDKEWKRWSEFIKNDSILRVSRWLTESINNMDSIYNYNQN